MATYFVVIHTPEPFQAVDNGVVDLDELDVAAQSIDIALDGLVDQGRDTFVYRTPEALLADRREWGG